MGDRSLPAVYDITVSGSAVSCASAFLLAYVLPSLCLVLVSFRFSRGGRRVG